MLCARALLACMRRARPRSLLHVSLHRPPAGRGAEWGRAAACGWARTAEFCPAPSPEVCGTGSAGEVDGQGGRVDRRMPSPAASFAVHRRSPPAAAFATAAPDQPLRLRRAPLTSASAASADAPSPPGRRPRGPEPTTEADPNRPNGTARRPGRRSSRAPSDPVSISDGEHGADPASISAPFRRPSCPSGEEGSIMGGRWTPDNVCARPNREGRRPGGG